MTHVVLLEPAARTSNEHELWKSIPDVELTVVSDRGGWNADRSVVLPAQRLPIVGGTEGWSAALARLKGLDRVELDGVDMVVSVELFSPFSIQANRLARRLGARHFVSIAETMADAPVYRWPPYRQITRQMIGRADGFVCLTERARNAAVAIGCPAERCVVVAPGVDSSEFAPAVDGIASAPNVLFVGMLRADRGADKGVFDLVHACADVASRFPDLQLTLVGEGHLEQELVRHHDRWPFVRILGRMPRSAIPDLMRSSRVLALPSRRTWKWEEQFGFALVEAMSCGLPVVSTRSGAIPEVVPAWNPLVEPGDRAALAAGIESMLGPEGPPVGRRNRADVLERFDLDRQGQRLIEALDDLPA